MAVLKRLLRSGGICEGAEILRFAQDDNVERITMLSGIDVRGDLRGFTFVVCCWEPLHAFSFFRGD